MLSKGVFLLRSSLPMMGRGLAVNAIPPTTRFQRYYRSRNGAMKAGTTEETSMDMNSTETTPEAGTSMDNGMDLVKELKESAMPNEVEKKEEEDCTPDAFELLRDQGEAYDNMSDAIRSAQNTFRNATYREEIPEKMEAVSENVSELNFEDEYIRLQDELNERFLSDDVNDTIKNPEPPKEEEISMLSPAEAKKYFDRILRMKESKITSEQSKELTDLFHSDKDDSDDTNEVKRSTWFNFMPAKEMPEGIFGTYTPDQIFSSLEFDLLSRNMEEVYKYEKDDLMLNDEILKHTKMPEPVEAPKIPNYPQFEEYAKWVTFALNRNADYSMEQKKKVVSILERLGSLTSEMDESPKTEFKIKKYL